MCLQLPFIFGRWGTKSHSIETAVAPDLDSKLIRVHLCWVGLVGHKGRFRRHFVRVTPAPVHLHHRPGTGSTLLPDPAHVLLCTPTSLATYLQVLNLLIHQHHLLSCLSSTNLHLILQSNTTLPNNSTHQLDPLCRSNSHHSFTNPTHSPPNLT